MASRQPSYPSTFTRVEPPAVLPAAESPSTDNARTARFVRSQEEHLPFYKTEGLALFAGWLEEERKLDEEAGETRSGKGKGRLSVPSRSSEGGIRAVDVLAAARAEQQSESSASAAKESSSGPSRVRLADRMKGKDGSAKTKRAPPPTAGAHKSAPPPVDDTKTKPGRLRDNPDPPAAFQGTDILLTRKETRQRANDDAAHDHSPSTAYPPPAATAPSRPSKRPSSTSNAPPVEALENAHKDKKRRRADPPDDPHGDAPHPNKPSPPLRPKHTSKHATKPAVKADLPPTPAKTTRSSKDKTKVKAAPTPSSGKENHDRDESNEVAVRLADRKARRRAKAAIINPKPRPPSSSSSDENDSSADDADTSSDSEPSETDADSRRKTRRVKSEKLNSKRRRADVAEDTSDRPTKKSKKHSKKDAGGKKGKKERSNRDLGASIGMGLGIMDTFKAGNIGGGPSHRLTLKRDFPKPGVFNKGRASSKVEAKGRRSGEAIGVPDLVFSEARFLSRPRPAPRTESTASADPPPRHRSTVKSQRQPSPPPAKHKKHSRPAPPVEDSEGEPERASSEDGGDRPTETVSKFFAVSKVKAPASKEKQKAKERSASPLPAKRVEYSPSWPETAEQEDARPKPASKEIAPRDQRPSSSLHSGGRQRSARSASSSHPSAQANLAPPRAQAQPSSAQHRPISSRHSDPTQRPSSRPHSGVFPLPIPPHRPPSPAPRVHSPPHDRSHRRQRLIYDGTSSVGDYDAQPPPRTANDHLRDLSGYPADVEEDLHYRRPQSREPELYLSELGEDADVFRMAGHGSAGRQARGRHADGSQSDASNQYDNDPTYGDGEENGSFDNQVWDDYAQEMDDVDPVGLSQRDEGGPYRPDPTPTRHRTAFYQLDQDQPYSDAAHVDHAPLSDISDGEDDDATDGGLDEPEPNTDGAIVDDDEVDWTNHWKRHRT